MRNGGPSKSQKAKSKIRSRVEPSSGNVFADVGMPHPELSLAKAVIVRRIRDLVEDRKLTQIQTAKLLKLDQPKVSALFRGRVDGYSLDRLFRYLTILGQQIEIRVRSTSRSRTDTGLNVVVAS